MPEDGCDNLTYTACITSLVYTNEMSPNEAARRLQEHVAEMELVGESLRSSWTAPARRE